MTKLEELRLKADTLLAMREDANEYHFHQVDRDWIIQAMIDFAELNHLYFGEACVEISNKTMINEAESFYGKGVNPDYEEGFIDGSMWYKNQL